MTLAEVVVAVGIVLVGLVALIAVMPLGTSLIGEANRKTTATFLAQQRMEQVKNAALRWTGSVDPLGGAGSDGSGALAQWPDEGYDTIVIPAGGACPPSSCYPRYRRQVRIADCSSVPCSGMAATGAAKTLRQVTVTVAFSPLAGTGQGQATEEPVLLITLIAQRS